MSRHVVLGAVMAAVVGCAGDTPIPTEFSVSAPVFAVHGPDANLRTHLSGKEEVLSVAPGAPSPADSRAQGQAIFQVQEDGTVSFTLIASNIHNVVQAHIHCAPAGSNGPIRMWLFPDVGTSGMALTGPTGRHDGVLASGSFSAAGVTCPATATAPEIPLLEAMRVGRAYVNVHTNDGASPGNTGPGDFPGGEIRGQI
jgi:hypothetical protein